MKSKKLGLSCSLAVVSLAVVGLLLISLPAGAQSLKFSIDTVTFDTQVVGTSSSAIQITLSNIDNKNPLRITKASTGDIPGDFALSDNQCERSLDPNQTCTVNIIFKPGALGARSGKLTVTSNATNNPQGVGLSGVGIPLKVTSVSGTLALGGKVTVTVDGLSNYVPSSPDKDPTKLLLYLNGNALKGTTPTGVLRAQKAVTYDLDFTPDNQGVWLALFHPPAWTRQVALSVGFDNGAPAPSVYDGVTGDSEGKKTVGLTVVPQGRFAAYVAVFLVFLVLFLWLEKSSGILRDTGPNPGAGKMRPYSLGRSQMAFWFFIVFASFAFIQLVTRSYNTITPQALTLMGISAATYLGAAVVDSSKSAAATAAPALASESFLMDILTDVNGISLHRFQLMVWTVALGFIFVSSVFSSLAMPQFNETLLGLMGISSGTYIGFKFPEKQQ
jgi:hypothetical protein